MDQLVDVRLLRQEAERIGLRASETEVRDAIAAMPVFQQDGRFNRDFYTAALRANRWTPGEFEEAEREEILVKKLQDVIGAGVHVNEAEVRDQYRLDNEQVNLQFLRFGPAPFVSEVSVSEEDVVAYFEAHKEDYREPQRARIEAIEFSRDKLADQVEVSEAEVEALYEARRAEYATPEQVRVRQILFKLSPVAEDETRAEVRQRAEAVLEKVQAGEDFAELARQHSEDETAEQGGDLGAVTRGQMLKPFEDAAFALEPGQVSAIVESPSGLHIIKVESKDEGGTRPLAEVRDEIVSSLRQEKAVGLAQSRAEAARERAAAGEALSDLAAEAGLRLLEPPPLTAGETIEGIGWNLDLTRAALSASPGEVGPVIASGPRFFVFRVTEKIESRVPELSEVRAQVEDELREERAVSVARTKAEEARAAFDGSNLEAVAAKFDLEIEETGPFTRPGPAVPKIGTAPDLKKEAFRLSAEAPAAKEVYSIGETSFVVVFKERLPADEETFEQEKERLMRQAEERRKGLVLQQFVNRLKAKSKVEVDEAFVASVIETGRALDGGPRFR
jgi:peptidyl-prolyl cis-trans isomerase D